MEPFVTVDIYCPMPPQLLRGRAPVCVWDCRPLGSQHRARHREGPSTRGVRAGSPGSPAPPPSARAAFACVRFPGQAVTHGSSWAESRRK